MGGGCIDPPKTVLTEILKMAYKVMMIKNQGMKRRKAEDSWIG
jgi:hypothetical protein